MKLKDHIKSNYGTNVAFAEANGYSKQYVGEMVKKGDHFVYDGMLVLKRKNLKKGNEDE